MEKETQEVIDELRLEGFEFDGDEPKDDKPEEKKEDEKPKDPEQKDSPKDENQKDENINKDEEVVIERTPREPKKVKLPDGSETEAWRIKVKEKHEQKSENELLDKIGGLIDKKLEALQLNNKTASEKQVEDAFKSIADKYDLGEKGADFISELANVFSEKFGKNNIPDDVKTKLGMVDELASEKKKTQEDLEFEKSFNKEVLSEIKKINNNLSEDEIQSIKDKIKPYYFSNKYINLSAGEIFTLKRSEFSDIVDSKKKRPVDDGSRGGSRASDVVDYENLTEDEYEKLSDEEQEKVDQYRIRKQKGM